MLGAKSFSGGCSNHGVYTWKASVSVLEMEPRRNHFDHRSLTINRTFQDEIDFASGVRQLCKKHNVLFISDEVRMGCGKSGKFLCSDWLGPENKPDLINIGKSITGGAYPASFVLGTNEVMSVVGPYESASTYAGTPMAIALVRATLQIMDEEKIVERAAEMQKKWEAAVVDWRHPFIAFTTARGGDFNVTLKMDHVNERLNPRRIAALCLHKGLLVYPLEGRVRMSVSMIITDEQLAKGFSILKDALDSVTEYDEIAGSVHKSASHA